MEMIKCPKCGNNLPKGSAFCSYCGVQFATPINNAPKRKKNKIWLLVLMAIVFIGVIGKMGGNDNETKSNTATESSSASQVVENKETETKKESVSTPDLTKEDVISMAEDIPYKTLKRNPDEYKGKYLILTVKIEQILKGGLFSDKEYYRVYTEGNSGFWYGDEYFMYDSRIDDDMKLLDDDIIKVYARFLGAQTVTRALTDTKEDVPAFEVLYLELIEDEDSALVDEAILNDGTIDIDFEDYSIKYDSYEITKDYEDKDCIIIYYDFTNNSDEAAAASYSLSLKLFQDGISCDSAFIFNNEFIANGSKEVTKGTTIRVGEAFKLSSKNELTLEASELFSFNGIKDSMLITLE